MRRLGILALLGSVLVGAGCDSPARTGAGSGGGSGAGTGGAGGAGNGGAGGAAACGTELGIAMHPSEGGQHIVVCDPVTYASNPPSSGRHYGVWPAYKTYAAPIPWGFLVHGLEHGGIVVVYNCPGGCADEVAAAQAWIDALPVDAVGCVGDRPRIVLAPDPTLDVRWAATAWTWTLRSCTFDEVMFRQFFDEHYDHGGEVICRSAGDADQSATGWCP
jgi:hypothetical protein